MNQDARAGLWILQFSTYDLVLIAEGLQLLHDQARQLSAMAARGASTEWVANEERELDIIRELHDRVAAASHGRTVRERAHGRALLAAQRAQRYSRGPV